MEGDLDETLQSHGGYLHRQEAIMSDLISFALRMAEPTDVNFVYDSWLRSYEYQTGDEAADARVCRSCGRMGRRRDVSGGEANAEIHPSDYWPGQRQRIDRLLATTAAVIVAHPAETPSVIAGWACVDNHPDVVHYVYVREFYRKRGIAKRLIEGRKVCTHLTESRRPDSATAWKRRMGMRYLPHLLDAA
jgi:GNAT superfamily N-acetyltransferase